VSQARWKGNGAGRPPRWRERSVSTARRQKARSALVMTGAGAGRVASAVTGARRFSDRCMASMASKMRRAEKRLRTPLLSTAELASRLSDADWRVVDCRFELGKPEAGRAAYAAGHIPGAIYADLERDLSAAIGPATGRHPLPGVAEFVATLSRLGIGNDTKVACYDGGSGAFAARLWWMLRWMGHDAVAVLDGGLAAWTGEGRPLSTEAPAPRTARFVPNPRPEMALDTAGVERALARGEVLVDVRGAERYAGVTEPIDAVAGHVPGALNLPYTQNLDASGRFRGRDELAALWRERTGAAAGRAPICMCGSGVTACQGLLALALAGVPDGRLYTGSWSEWIRDPARPVARGAT
jgi:thiosulfate/3-mercaptopyruvate sulfurtransferase